MYYSQNFVCLWRRHNCRSQVIDLSLFCAELLIYEIIIGFLNNSNIHAIVSTSFIINLQWVEIIYFAVLEEIFNDIVPHWSAFLISRNHSITRLIIFTKEKPFKLEINSFCIWTLFPKLPYIDLRNTYSTGCANFFYIWLFCEL
jgi:hypothetical protein